MTNTPSLRDRAAGAPAPTARDQLVAMRARFAAALPDGHSVERFEADCQTVLSSSPELADCGTTFLGAMMTCAQLGLRPGVLGEAYVLPYGRKAQLIIGYQGLIALAYRSPLVKGIQASVVRDGDEISVVHGRTPPILHSQQLRGQPGPTFGYYVQVELTTGGHVSHYMTREEVEEFRAKHTKPGSGPWKDHFDAMALKTVMRQVAKWLPKNVELSQALRVDGGVRHDVSGQQAPEAVTVYVDGEVVDETTGEIQS